MIRRVFLADFGIARPVDDISGITTTNMTVGTVAYAAPEQLMGEAMDGRADQYALAATAYHLLTGSQLFPHSNPAVVISRHLNAPVPALADIRPDLASLDPILAAALAKNPDDRFACCTDFARAFTETAAPQTLRVVAAPTTPAPAARRPHVTPTRSKTVGANCPERLCWLRHAVADRGLRCSGIAAARCYRGAVAAMAAPAVQYHRHLIEQCTDHVHPDPDRDGSRTIRCRPAAGDRHAAPTTSTAQVQTGPTIGDECYDWMKFSTDPLSGQEMLCSGYPDNLSRGEPMTWYSAEAGAVGPSAGWRMHPVSARPAAPAAARCRTR